MADQTDKANLSDNEVERNDDNDAGNTNELYDLLDADQMTTASSLNSNLRDCTTSFGGFELFREAEDHGGFRNAASMLGDAQINTPDADVYRSVAALDFGTQRNMATTGMEAFDSPIEPLVAPKSGLVDPLLQSEPTPRVFSRLRLEHTHMFLVSSLKELISTLSSELAAAGADFMFEPTGCFWRAMVYPEAPAMAVDFRVYLNSCPTIGTNRYVAEFVRRSGCTMAFNQLFSQVRDSMIAMSIVTKENGDSVHSLRDLPVPFGLPGIAWEASASSRVEAADTDCPLPRPLLGRASSATTCGLEDNDLDDELFRSAECTDEDLFQPLFDMSKSSFEDVHVQGLALVAHEAKKEGHAERMATACPDLVGLIVRRLTESSHPEVRRHCSTALCALASVKGLHPSLIAEGALVVLADVAAVVYSPATGETQRQAACALSNMCSNADSLGAVLEAVHDKAEQFAQLAEKCEDPRLTKSISDVRASLQAC